MGGRIAIELLHTYPTHFNKGILLSTNLGLATEEEKKMRAKLEEEWIQKITTFGIKQFVDDWYKSPLFEGFKIPAYRYNQSASLIIQTIQKFSLAKQQNFWNSFHEISSRCTFLYGENDRTYQPVVEKLKNLNADVHLIEKCSHAIHLQNVSACIKHIERGIYVETMR